MVILRIISLSITQNKLAFKTVDGTVQKGEDAAKEMDQEGNTAAQKTAEVEKAVKDDLHEQNKEKIQEWKCFLFIAPNKYIKIVTDNGSWFLL